MPKFSEWLNEQIQRKGIGSTSGPLYQMPVRANFLHRSLKEGSSPDSLSATLKASL